MSKTFLYLLLSLPGIRAFAQNTCIRHWAKDDIENRQLDSIFSTVSFEEIDSTFCNYQKETIPDFKSLINFYNKQIGKYFSDSKSVNFMKFYSKLKNDEYFNEISIIQFDLPQKDLDKFIAKYGVKINGYKFFNLNVFILYRYLVKDNSVYFISTESYERGNPKSGYFFNQIFEAFVHYK